jgi:pyruvate dehydrogenase E2 component (dihydrolipoamide acetyltransferase)
MAHAKSTDPNIFILPDLGEGVHEAELISWKVQPGDTVEEHQIVAEMETDKALVEVPSPRAGRIKQLNGNPGDILKVGEVAWTYEGAGATASEPKPAARSATRVEPEEHRERNNGSHKKSSDDGEREDAGTVVGTMSGSLGAVSSEGGKALATPAVRRLARDLGVDIDSVAGTGLAGRVTEKDVRAAADGGGRAAPRPTPAAAPAPTPAAKLATTVRREPEVVNPPAPRTTLVPVTGDSQRIAIRGVRRTIAARLRESVDNAVHFTVMDEADVTDLDDVRQRLGAASGEKVSYLPFVVSAVCRALQKFPALNAHVDDEAQEIVRHSRVHIGIAADTEHGLAVPVIPEADAMGVLEMGRHIAEIARMTRERSIPRERLMGSTFTISNVGSYAGRFATPIINYPEVGILAVGRVREGVVAKRGGIHVAKLLPLSLTCDHRSVDGADAARCLNYIIELLGKPEGLVTPARG